MSIYREIFSDYGFMTTLGVWMLCLIEAIKGWQESRRK